MNGMKCYFQEQILNNKFYVRVIDRVDAYHYNITNVSLCLQLVLLKAGGRMIYCGPLGQDSSKLIEYFEVSSQGSTSMGLCIAAFPYWLEVYAYFFNIRDLVYLYHFDSVTGHLWCTKN